MSLTEQIVVDVHVGNTESIIVDGAAPMDLDALLALFRQRAGEDPQPVFRVDIREPDNYVLIGRLIYGFFRAGFEEGKLQILPPKQP